MRVFIATRKFDTWMICQGIVLLALLLTGVPTVGWAADFQGCRSCHQAELERAEIRLNQHEPFMQRQCATCHAAAASATGLKTSSIPTAAVKTRPVARKVNWLAESSQADTAHSFLLPADQLGAKLVVDLRGEQTLFPRQEIDLPLLKDVAGVNKPADAPTISAIKILEVKRSVFLSVLIGWKTDALSDAQVRYGIQGLSQNSDRSQRFGRSHQVRLYNLKPDQRYQFQVVSTDLFGRSKSSEVFEFSTKKPIEAEGAPVASGAEVSLQSGIERLGNDYLVHLKTQQPVAVFVGSVGELRTQQAEVEASAVAVTAHDGLSSGVDREVVACLNCHREYGQRTHPVNVLPKPGMTIPPEYPTLSDGRITCASCHLTHSSDNPYLAIRRGKRELCVGCHKDML